MSTLAMSPGGALLELVTSRPCDLGPLATALSAASIQHVPALAVIDQNPWCAALSGAIPGASVFDWPRSCLSLAHAHAAM